jgi:4-diphosphocytidyl-2-C-methyl-D-erythritol kinase
VLAPAKINLGLRVVGRRADGFHLLESVFLPLDLADDVEVALLPGGQDTIAVEGDVRGVPANASNLALRAAALFREAAVREAAVREVAGLGGVRVRLRKRIPAAAGLGGGSSDAAAVLRVLAQLTPGAVDAMRLAELALRLGADVPFFLDPRPALVSGIGERIEPLAGVPGLALVLALPGTSLSTAAVFRDYDLSRAALTPAGAGPSMVGRLAAWTAAGLAAASTPAELLVNDLEPAATRLAPALAPLKRKLAQCGALVVGLSGSGPTVYGIFEDRRAAQEAAHRLALAAPARAIVASTLPSPAAGSPTAGSAAD